MENNSENNIRPQEADGIQECDNPLPKWWVGLFIFCILWGVGYIFYYHVFDGKDHLERFNIAMDKREEIAKEAEVAAQNEDLDSKLNDPQLASSGLEDYASNCAACHGPEGQGLIGPNLTDGYWIHGGDANAIIKVISEGVLEKGMPPWKDVLGQKKSEQLTALIVSWRGKNLAGKEKQGELFEPKQ